MLQNVTWLAIVAIHTAANEPPEVRQVMNKIHRNVGVAYAAESLQPGCPARGRAAFRAVLAATPAELAGERCSSFLFLVFCDAFRLCVQN